MTPDGLVPDELARMHRALVDALHTRGPEAVLRRFTVAEIYQDLIPYRTHRDLLGVAMNGDYEHLILRLLAGEGGLLAIESDSAREAFRLELDATHPNTGIFREYAGLDVRLEGSHRVSVDDPTQGALFDAGADGLASDDEAEPASFAGDVAQPDSLARDAVPVDTITTAPESESADPGDTASPSENRPMSVPPDAAPSSPPTSNATGACLWCDEALPARDDLRFCPFCGQDVQIRPCARCEAPVEPGWRFCVACGHGADIG